MHGVGLRVQTGSVGSHEPRAGLKQQIGRLDGEQSPFGPEEQKAAGRDGESTESFGQQSVVYRVAGERATVDDRALSHETVDGVLVQGGPIGKEVARRVQVGAGVRSKRKTRHLVAVCLVRACTGERHRGIAGVHRHSRMQWKGEVEELHFG